MKADILEKLHGLAPVIKKICSVAGVPGLSLGVAHHGEIVHTANFGYRNLEDSIPPDSDTIYGVASITKIFTASAIGALVDEGKLDWTTPIVSILPELNSQSSSVTQELTIVDLLTHRVGLEKSNNWWFGSDGVLLLDKSQTISSYNALKKTEPFRTSFGYTNWGYTLIGEVIERLSGMSYGQYIQRSIVDPLGLNHTSTTNNYTDIEHFAKPYAALDDGSFSLLPPPAIQDGTIMAAAQGIRSTVNDLLKFSSALLHARKGQPSPLKNVEKQFSGHIFRYDNFLEKSYALGLFRNVLPECIGGGCNSQFCDIPIIVPGNEARLVASHGGSQAGYTSFLTMLPEIDVSLVVLTNSIGLADPTGWVNELLVETLVESPQQIDFVKYAKEAAQNHIDSYPKMEKKLEANRTQDAPPKVLQDYVGTYFTAGHQFKIEIRYNATDSLQVAFQGLDSQAWPLRHYEHDTFLWLSSRDEQARRARFTYSGPGVYKIIFSTGPDGAINGLYWPHDPSVPERDQWFKRVESSATSTKGIQAGLKDVAQATL